MSTTKPEAGKKYRVVYEIEVGNMSAHYAWREGENPGDASLPITWGEWTEIEPEYEVGALYEAMDGTVFRRTSKSKNCWLVLEPSGHYIVAHHLPKRPLERLYRASEVGK